MEMIITAITVAVALYVLIKVTNSQVTAVLADAGTRIIEVNAKESIFDSEQRLGNKLKRAKETGKAITTKDRIALEVEFGLSTTKEDL